mgnify:CR=1 FL=1
MQPRTYIDFFVTIPERGPGTNALAHNTVGVLFKFVHAIAANIGFAYGAAFPKAKVGDRVTTGDVVRIFAHDRSNLDALADRIEAQPFAKRFLKIGRIKTVEDADILGYVEYLRFRIPNRKSRLQESRERRMDEADEYPYINLTSSTGHDMTLRIKPIFHATEKCEDAFSPGLPESFQPDIYGLSVFERRFALPVFEDDTVVKSIKRNIAMQVMRPS